MKRIVQSILFSFWSITICQAQIGGTSVYNFLNVYPNARIAALGGSAIVTPDNDMSLVLANPSLLTKKMQNQFSMNYLRYFADMGMGYFGYAWNTKSARPLSAGVHYINYGVFDKTDESGNIIGSFAANDFCFHFSTSRIYQNWNIGVNAKVIYSEMESYTSLGLAADVAASWRSEDSLMMVTAVVSNLGKQLISYTQKNSENLPINIQIGFSKKFAHNPLRLSLIAHNLQDIGNLLYQNSGKNSGNTDLVTGQIIPEQFTILDYAMSHLIANSEVIFGPGFMLRFGYNNLRRRELSLPDTRTFAGFSWGFGIKINKFHFSYGSASFYADNATNNFSIVTNLSEFYKKK